MGTNPIGFFTGQEYTAIGMNPAQPGQRPTTKYGYAYVPNATSVTLPELLGFDAFGASVPAGQGLSTITANVKANAIPALVQYAGIKIGFKVGKKLLSKQRSFINNQILKPLGMKSTVVV